MYAFNSAAIFYPGHPYIESTTVLSDYDTYFCAEIRFQLNGAFYGNNSVVDLSDIGVGSNTLGDGDSMDLRCLTDSTQCCRGSDNPSGVLGEWYFPDGTPVPAGTERTRNIYRNRGPSVVRLNRRNNAQSPTGVYRCEIPDASGTTQSIFVGVKSNGIQGR